MPEVLLAGDVFLSSNASWNKPCYTVLRQHRLMVYWEEDVDIVNFQRDCRFRKSRDGHQEFPEGCVAVTSRRRAGEMNVIRGDGGGEEDRLHWK